MHWWIHFNISLSSFSIISSICKSIRIIDPGIVLPFIIVLIHSLIYTYGCSLVYWTGIPLICRFIYSIIHRIVYFSWIQRFIHLLIKVFINSLIHLTSLSLIQSVGRHLHTHLFNCSWYQSLIHLLIVLFTH